MMAVVVAANFCETGFGSVAAALVAGRLPLTVVCGHGTGKCVHGGPHTAICLARFHSMTLTVTVPELAALVRAALAHRDVPELGQVLVLVPGLCEHILPLLPGLALAALPDPFRTLLADRPARPVDWRAYPLGAVWCLSAYLDYLDRRPFRRCTACANPVCPFARLQRALLRTDRLPAELLLLVFEFLCPQ